MEIAHSGGEGGHPHPGPASVGSLADFEDMLALTRLFVADQAARL